jgi:hypothetical protein
LDHAELWSSASRSDLRLLRRAIRQDWPVPEERRQSLLDEVFPLIHRGDTRLAIAVAWVLVEAEAANMRAERELQR